VYPERIEVKYFGILKLPFFIGGGRALLRRRIFIKSTSNPWWWIYAPLSIQRSTIPKKEIKEVKWGSGPRFSIIFLKFKNGTWFKFYVQGNKASEFAKELQR